MPDSGWFNLYSVSGYLLSLEGEDSELHQLANAVYSAARVDCGTADIAFRLTRTDDSRKACANAGAETYCMSAAGVELCRQRNLADFFLDVEWTLTHQAMSGCRSLIQVHAGAVAMHGAGLLVCGPPGSGKTSLVVGLSGHGATILTDEVGLLQADPRRAEIDLIPFRRDLIVHRRTQQLFPHSAYGEEPCFKRFPDHCHVSPNRLDSTSGPPPPVVPLTGLLFTSFKPGEGLALARLGPAEAARRLLLETYNLESLGERCAELLARVVESCPAWVLRYDDAVEASALVAAFVLHEGR